jgi:predicted DNA-binding transcriptional regulator AlpA
VTKRTFRVPDKTKRERFVFVADLMRVLGVSRRTIFNYVQAGMLPAPILHSDGRTGVHSRWTRVALDQAEFIAEHQRLKYTNAEIRAMIGALWGTDDKLPPTDVLVKRKR